MAEDVKGAAFFTIITQLLYVYMELYDYLCAAAVRQNAISFAVGALAQAAAVTADKLGKEKTTVVARVTEGLSKVFRR